MPSRLVLSLLCASVAIGSAALGVIMLQSGQAAPSAPKTESKDLVRAEKTTGAMLPLQSDWLDGVFDEGWRSRGSERRSEPREERDEEERAPRRHRSWQRAGTYRTLCVRLCDGFYFPISFSTYRSRFKHDANACDRRCPSRARLFVHRNPGEQIEDMVDLDGNPYQGLSNAFVYRTQYVADCTCRGNPWDQEALARHRAYAEAAKNKDVAKIEKPKVQTEARVRRVEPPNRHHASREARWSQRMDRDENERDD